MNRMEIPVSPLTKKKYTNDKRNISKSNRYQNTNEEEEEVPAQEEQIME